MITTFEGLHEIRQENSDRTIALRIGCYDLLHEGHVSGINFAKQQADLLVMGVRPDATVMKRKGPGRPIRPEVARLAVVNALRDVDYALILPEEKEDSPPPILEVIQDLRPDVLVAFKRSNGSHPNNEIIRSIGTRIIFDTSPQMHSTTAIVQRILETSTATQV